MNASFMSIFLFLLAGLALIAGLEGIAIVFVVIALAIIYYDSVTNKPVEVKEEHPKPAAAQPQVIVIQKGGHEGISHAIAEELVEHDLMSKARPHPDHTKHLEKEIKGLEKETSHLKKQINALKKDKKKH